MEIKSIRKLLKGKWKYNIYNNQVVCSNKTATYFFENKDNEFFQGILSTLNARGVPEPYMEPEYPSPTAIVPLEQFHRVMRANEILYLPEVMLTETKQGLNCSSEHIPKYVLNHHKYKQTVGVKVDPNKICKITRVIRSRERVTTKILLHNDYVLMENEYPWMKMTSVIPTIQVR